MFIKQIDEKTALDTRSRVPGGYGARPRGKGTEMGSMMPDTLQKMLEGCLFFRREPAMEKGGIE